MSRNSKPTNVFRRLILVSLPSVAGWHTFPRALLNVLLFASAALGGEWILHQIVYFLHYGSHFNAVMASTLHRFYMGPTGVVLASIALGTFALGAGALVLAAQQRERLLLQVSSNLHRRAPQVGLSMPWRNVAWTALVLAVSQISIYLFQENLEAFAQSGHWAGFSILLPQERGIALPIDLTIATSLSLILWTLSCWLGASRQAVRVARILVVLFGLRRASCQRLSVGELLLPDLRLRAGTLCLRSPPRFA